MVRRINKWLRHWGDICRPEENCLVNSTKNRSLRRLAIQELKRVGKAHLKSKISVEYDKPVKASDKGCCIKMPDKTCLILIAPAYSHKNHKEFHSKILRHEPSHAIMLHELKGKRHEHNHPRFKYWLQQFQKNDDCS